MRGVAIAAALVLGAACAIGEPDVVCDATQFTPPSPLNCEAAVDAAIAGLPQPHSEIGRIIFRYGNYCPPAWECPMTSSEFGVVFFEFTDLATDVYVEVVATSDGVEIRSGPAPGSP